MKYKNNKTIIAFLTAIVILASVVFAAIPNAVQVKVTLISQEPDPANPGDVIDLRFKVENMGSSATGDLIFEILPQYPFSVYSGSAEKSVGSIQGRQVGDEGVIILYKIKVDENAAEREDKIDLRYRAEDDKINPTWIYAKDFPIRIRTRDLVVSIESITTSPDPVSPGKESILSLKIKNNADSLIRDLKVKLDTSATTVPFAPVRSTTEKSVYQLEAKKEVEFRFDIIAAPNADGGVYKVPLTISYTDETGTSYSKQDVIGLKIASEPDILAVIDSTDIYSKKKSGKVSIKIVNRGLTEMKLLTATLESNKNFEVLSQSDVYVGSIDSDDYETVDYTIDIKSKEETVTLPLELKYKDSTNKEFRETKDVVLRIFSSSDAKKAGMIEKQSVGLTITILIVIVGVGVYLWRRKKKKKSSK